jgi:hypothetical protein
VCHGQVERGKSVFDLKLGYVCSEMTPRPLQTCVSYCQGSSNMYVTGIITYPSWPESPNPSCCKHCPEGGPLPGFRLVCLPGCLTKQTMPCSIFSEWSFHHYIDSSSKISSIYLCISEGTLDRCYDLKIIFANKFGEKIGIFYTKYS